MDTKTKSEKPADKKPKKPLWKRIVKGLLWFLGGTLVFVLVAVLTLPLWINPVATSLAKSLVPSKDHMEYICLSTVSVAEFYREEKL